MLTTESMMGVAIGDVTRNHPDIYDSPALPLTTHHSLHRLMMTGAQNFIESGDAFEGFGDAVFEEGAHAHEASLAADFLRGRAVEGHFAHRGVHAHQFEDAESAAESGVVAVIAAAAAHEVGALQLVWLQ